MQPALTTQLGMSQKVGVQEGVVAEESTSYTLNQILL